MKRLLVFLLICMSSIGLFAQFHYQVVTTGVSSGSQTTMTAKFMINGVEEEHQTDPTYGESNSLGYIEIGVFDQNGDCRGTKRGRWYKSTRWVYQLQFRGEEGFTYTFKVYDHNLQKELDLVPDLTETIEFRSTPYGALTNLYELNFVPTAQTITLPLSGWDSYEGELNGGYHLIATPVDNVKPTEVVNMVDQTAENYDLYTFNQNEEEEWRNYKADADQDNFKLAKGMGYLYAHNTEVTLEFTGTPLTEAYTVTLTKGADMSWEGWNLVGNSFTEAVNINKPFHRMNEAGDGYETAEGEVRAMEAVFVEAEEDGETLEFSLNAKKAVRPSLNVNLRNGNRVIDNAIVHFDQGSQLPKLQFRQGSTKVYIPMDDKDYAVVSTESMGELPVNFKAEKNGSYTLSFTAEEVSFGYLHLIDNMTGNDVDLLANPSYSFEASTTDYESRFKLVFATGNADDTFAFFSNGNFVINNEGNATLQVVDVNGRILSNETINGCANVNVNAAAGVYMLRLVNGDNVKTQKVVVR